MKKLFNGLLIFILILASTVSLSACDEDSTTTEVETGAVYDIETDDDGVKYAVLEKYTISEEDAKTVADGGYDSLMVDLSINTYTDSKGTEYPVKEISSGAFTDQLTLRSLVIGSNVETIGMSCLAGCVNLKSLTVPFVGATKNAVNEKKTLGYLFGTSEVTGSTSVTVNYNSTATSTYYVPNALETVTVTGNAISDYAFNGLTVKNIVLSGAVTEISSFSFMNMTNLGTVDIPNSIVLIGQGAFKGCTNLYKVNYKADSKVETIYQDAFNGCTKLGAFNNTVALPNSLKTLYKNAFNGCTSIETINLSNTQLTAIPSGCFANCTKLKTVTLPTAIITYPIDAFALCDENITIA